MFKCIKKLLIEMYDDDGFPIGDDEVIKVGSLWHYSQNDNYRFIGGEVRLECDDLRWIEITNETLEKHFKTIEVCRHK